MRVLQGPRNVADGQPGLAQQLFGDLAARLGHDGLQARALVAKRTPQRSLLHREHARDALFRRRKFRSAVLEQDLILTPDKTGTAHITQDNFGNTYDRAGGEYSNFKP